MYKLSSFVLLVSIILVNGRTVFDDVIGGNVLNEEWQLFKQQHAKVYRNRLEDRHRNKIFLKNKLEIAEHNKLYELGQVSFKLGLNEYSDLEHNEFIARMTCGKNTSIVNIPQFEFDAVTYIKPEFTVPSSIDWRAKGAVTPVKNQEQCGSCWAFSSTGSLEAQHFRKTGTLISLSEQNLVDCSRKYGNHGCSGGFETAAFKYIRDNGGIETEKTYPYEARDGNCRYESKHNSGVKVKGYSRIRQGDEDALKAAVATSGPISVGIDASRSSFGHYRGGLYYEPTCDPKNINHAVLIVGYGTTAKGQDYWIVKNSWGKTWGQSGYIFMARNRGNNCGISSDAVFPLV